MENEKKKLHVIVPSWIVRNEKEDFYLSNDEFVMYARLCFLYFRNYHKKEIEIDHKKLMIFLKMTDTRTFKKRLEKLYQMELIENKITSLPTKGKLTIIFNDKKYEEEGHFTMLSAEVFKYWQNDQIDEYAFRQLFYYKSHINTNMEKSSDNKPFCFVGYDTLTKRLKISKSKVEDANKQLKDAKLITVTVHQLNGTDTYNDDIELFTRYTNHYYVAKKLH